MLLTLQRNLSMACFRLGEFQQSRDAASRALEIDPNYVKARFRRAVANRKLGECSAAMTDLKLAKGLDPGNRVVYKEIVSIRKEFKNAKEARKAQKVSLQKAFSSEKAKATAMQGVTHSNANRNSKEKVTPSVNHNDAHRTYDDHSVAEALCTMGIECASGNLCTMKDIPLAGSFHHCVNCKKKMHGPLCAGQGREDGENLGCLKCFPLGLEEEDSSTKKKSAKKRKKCSKRRLVDSKPKSMAGLKDRVVRKKVQLVTKHFQGLQNMVTWEDREVDEVRPKCNYIMMADDSLVQDANRPPLDCHSRK